jgi:hypothetical protein
MPDTTLEQRIAVLEQAVRELQESMKARTPAPDWLERVIGSMKEEPAFDEVLAHGRAIRQADRPRQDLAHEAPFGHRVRTETPCSALQIFSTSAWAMHPSYQRRVTPYGSRATSTLTIGITSMIDWATRRRSNGSL